MVTTLAKLQQKNGKPPRRRRYSRTYEKARRILLDERTRQAAADGVAICEDCAASGKAFSPQRVEWHHPIKAESRPDLMVDPSNCRWLCKPCHSVRTSRGE